MSFASRPHPIGDPAELAALYISGAMPLDESAAFEVHLAEGCEACATELVALDGAARGLLWASPEATVRPDVRSSILSRLGEQDSPARANPQAWKGWQSDAPPPGELYVRRAGEGDWEPIDIDGIFIRRLFVDRDRNQVTMLVRMDPGTAYPRHVHHGPEECFVLQGDLRVGDDVLHAGDYQRAEPESLHVVQSTLGGCTLLIVSSLTDELVD